MAKIVTTIITEYDTVTKEVTVLERIVREEAKTEVATLKSGIIAPNLMAYLSEQMQ